MVTKNRKNMIKRLTSFKKQVMNGTRIEKNGLILLTKVYVKKSEARAYIKSLKNKTKTPVTLASVTRFYHTSETEKIGELLHVPAGKDNVTYSLYKYLK